ncbi:hypothetical protein N7495_001648 [Penicillium taxi]|uniref:uncharacterized protein n=1 Tax=Penicillium taxi TaxID=168475 RepID=UPI0025450D46|nr:uncharacterized protein N7495_001648 [Penicillium taxi]KAJ5908966.1 hypothetical protein N7495_001648 [Penicillium taxi]
MTPILVNCSRLYLISDPDDVDLLRPVDYYKDYNKMDDIGDRLRSHAQAFDGLLSLIPAKYYYGDDTTDQWKKKKQTKEQAREAKRAKLDPEAAKTAKDVMDEKARKRKREDGIIETDESEEELGSEMPREGLTRGEKAKKQKQVEKSAIDATAKSEEAEARKKLKEEKANQKKAAQKEKKKAKEAARKEKIQSTEKSADADETKTETKTEKTEQKPASTPAAAEVEDSDNEDGDDIEDGVVEEGFSIDFKDEPEQTSTDSSTPDDASNDQSGSSSISSIVPPTSSAKSSEPKPLRTTSENLKQRLQKRLDELRAARCADGLNGQPARNRHELIEARRQKAEQRKSHKKELRQKAREEAQQKADEAMVRRFSPGGSGSLLASPRSPAESVGSSSNNFSFGRVVFADGQHADASLTGVLDKHKSNGPTDPAAQLKAAEAKKVRLAEMDPTKRAEIEEKDRWLNAKKRAHGERVRDDTSLLKKALKRKETAKKKSAREWSERIDTVSHNKEQRQHKREENLRKRRDEKGNKGKSKKPSGNSGKKKGRPGFEGSFKSKPGGGGKKK